MNAFRGLRAVARPRVSTSPASALLRPSVGRMSVSQSINQPAARSISLLTPRRPVLPISTPIAPSTATPATTTTLPSSEALDLLPKISSHPGLAGVQIRCGPRNTFNPSHFVRKRRHGWLSRIRTKNGRKILMRRLKKGRWNLSH